jgi:hypothetical protein
VKTVPGAQTSGSELHPRLEFKVGVDVKEGKKSLIIWVEDPGDYRLVLSLINFSCWYLDVSAGQRPVGESGHG